MVSNMATTFLVNNMAAMFLVVRDWSLITGRGGYNTGGGGAREVLPLRKGGAEKVLAMLKGGAQKVLGSFLRGSLKF